MLYDYFNHTLTVDWILILFIIYLYNSYMCMYTKIAIYIFWPTIENWRCVIVFGWKNFEATHKKFKLLTDTSWLCNSAKKKENGWILFISLFAELSLITANNTSTTHTLEYFGIDYCNIFMPNFSWQHEKCQKSEI